jgi:hypothetical protein
VYSGTDFIVYSHVKNPFAVPVWIDAVELSLPTHPPRHQSMSVPLFHDHLGTANGSLVLAVILSTAAIVLAARKSEAQSFINVEDFWGGVLIGFLIGSSGTVAFTELTGVSS